MKRFGLINIISLIVLMIVITTVPTIAILSIVDKAMVKRFFGEVSKYQGVLTIWNIDTFEGGGVDKSKWFLSRGVDFEKEHKGLYISVVNKNEESLKIALAAGELPDMFSFGMGLGNELFEYLAELGIVQKTKTNILNSSLSDGKNYAAAWCMGGYGLFSTVKKLENAGLSSNVSLSDNILKAGYEKKLKKSTVVIKSVVFGLNPYIHPELAFKQVSGESNFQAFSAVSPFIAYNEFIQGNASVLLGSQRDVVRIENKVSSGGITGVVFEPVYGYNDLIEYIALTREVSGLKKEYCEKFIEYILSRKSQLTLSNINMLSCSYKIYTTGFLKEIEDALQSDFTAPKLFS